MRYVRVPWLERKDEFIRDIIIPIREGKRLEDIAKDLGISRQRVYGILRLFGFKNRKEVLEHVNYK